MECGASRSGKPKGIEGLREQRRIWSVLSSFVDYIRICLVWGTGDTSREPARPGPCPPIIGGRVNRQLKRWFRRVVNPVEEVKWNWMCWKPDATAIEWSGKASVRTWCLNGGTQGRNSVREKTANAKPQEGRRLVWVRLENSFVVPSIIPLYLQAEVCEIRQRWWRINL